METILQTPRMASQKEKIAAGTSFGEVKFLMDAEWTDRRRCKFLCKCGKEFESTLASVKRGFTKSCGCLRREISKPRGRDSANFVHGFAHKRSEYNIWNGMKDRCRNPNSKAFPRYGGRGIMVTERWMSFANFIDDMGERPSPNHSIDRIDNNGNYEPGNCRWATAPEQGRNTSVNRIIEFNGERKLLCEWAEKTGLPRLLIHHRLKLGWSTEDALTKPVKKRANQNTQWR